MKRFVGPVSLIAVLAVAVACVGTAVGSSTDTSRPSTAARCTEVVNGNNVTGNPERDRHGDADRQGHHDRHGRGEHSSNPPCSPLSGPGTLKGPKGTLKLKLTNSPAPSRACAAGQDDQNNISFSGSAKVTGGTGALKKAKGTLHYSGHYDRGTGAFNVKLTGTLKH